MQIRNFSLKVILPYNNSYQWIKILLMLKWIFELIGGLFKTGDPSHRKT